MPTLFRITALTDKELCQIFQELTKSLVPMGITESIVRHQIRIGNAIVTNDTYSKVKNTQAYTALASSTAKTVGTYELSNSDDGRNIKIQYERTADSNRRLYGYINLESISFSQDDPGRMQSVALATKIADLIRLFDISDAPVSDTAIEYQGQQELLQQTIVRLTNVSQQVIETHSKRLADYDAWVDQQRSRLDNDFLAQRQQLDSEYTGKREALDQDRSEFEAERNRFMDERERVSNQDARRGIRGEVKASINDWVSNFGVSEGTQKKRYVVTGLFIALILGLVYITTAFSQDVAIEESPTTWQLLRLIASSAGLAATFLYFIRWNDLWAQRHLDEELRARRIGIDMDRASWLVETMLEWRTATQEDFPLEVATRLAYGLYDGKIETSRATHPYEDILRSFGGLASEANLDIPGFGSLKISGKSLDKLQKQETASKLEPKA